MGPLRIISGGINTRFTHRSKERGLQRTPTTSWLSLFPLYHRNPQTFVETPLFPTPEDFRKATITLLRSADAARAVWLPVVPYVNSGSF
jgi:hypothetical protein